MIGFEIVLTEPGGSRSGLNQECFTQTHDVMSDDLPVSAKLGAVLRVSNVESLQGSCDCNKIRAARYAHSVLEHD